MSARFSDRDRSQIRDEFERHVWAMRGQVELMADELAWGDEELREQLREIELSW